MNLKEIFVNLVEENFPKGKCEERGNAMVLVGKAIIQIREELNDKFQKMRSFDPDTREGAGYYACNTQAMNIIKSFCEVIE